MAAPAAAAEPRLGRVSAFDARRGLGTVTASGGVTYGFHATAIADGTRRIDEGVGGGLHRGAGAPRSL